MSVQLYTTGGAKSGPTRLWLIRHARPVIEAGTCYGSLDVPADAPATRLSAQNLAAALPAGTPVQVSPLLRCRQLAEALLMIRPDLEVRVVPALAEMDFGSWEGRPWQAVGQAAMDEWTASFANHRPGGGESVTEFMTRVSIVFDAARRKKNGNVNGGGDVAWITHAGVIRAVTLLCRGVRNVADAKDWPAEASDFGNWKILTLPDNDAGRI